MPSSSFPLTGPLAFNARGGACFKVLSRSEADSLYRTPIDLHPPAEHLLSDPPHRLRMQAALLPSLSQPCVDKALAFSQSLEYHQLILHELIHTRPTCRLVCQLLRHLLGHPRRHLRYGFGIPHLDLLAKQPIPAQPPPCARMSDEQQIYPPWIPTVLFHPD